MTTPSPACQVCAEPALREIIAFKKINRVTSDCKPWPAGGQLFMCTACAMVQKQATFAWHEETARIYDDYALYPQGKGAEQSVFDTMGQTTASRSDAIISQMAETISLAENGSLLDIGCGNGAFLAAFARHHKGWQFHGSELDARNLSAIKKIPGFEKLHTGALSLIADKFDLISIIHALEHIENPHQFLAQVGQNLATPESVIVIEVPDWGSNPFDLLIADHLLHFAMPSLVILLGRAGLTTLSIANDWVTKEISLLARQSPGDAHRQDRATPDPERTRAELEGQLRWLDHLLAKAKALCDSAANDIGIFGTSIAAAWLYGGIRQRVGFFVDEDPNRVGGSLFGLPILAPADVPQGADVFVPLPNATANRVAHRLGREEGPHYTVPEGI